MSRMIRLRPRREFRFPVTADCITPEVFGEKTLEEIAQLEAWEGNRRRNLGELFSIEKAETSSQSEETIEIQGNIVKVRRVGAGMSGGEITVRGNAGMHLGEGMKGGKITVHGNTGSWTGSMMKDGAIEVHGNVGDYLGAPYRGSTEGMAGGRIIVHGNAGNEAGANMKKGLIKICGNVGQFAGFRMRNGTVYVQKDCAGRAGACMHGGKIVIEGFLESMLPSFTIDGIRGKVKIEENEVTEMPFYVFLGDLAEDGNGKVYVSKEKNPQLCSYERLL